MEVEKTSVDCICFCRVVNRYEKIAMDLLHLHMGSLCVYVEDSFPVGADRQTLSPWSKAAFAIVLKRKDLPMVQKNDLYNNFEPD